MISAVFNLLASLMKVGGGVLKENMKIWDNENYALFFIKYISTKLIIFPT